jgi:predicted secreted hydrolase
VRRLLAAMLLALFATSGAAFDPVRPGATLVFPRDLGAHPGYRIEWWYVTGQLASPGGPLGFQVTFFRLRNPEGENRASRFAPGQVLFAHAALSDPKVGHLLHDQRSARALPPLVEALTGDTRVRIDDWTLVREGGAYRTHVGGDDFALDLSFKPTQPLMLQGDRGYSRKGSSGAQASYYYSEPQLEVTGRVSAHGHAIDVTGTAWLDHEWSSEVLASEAAGWDWLGANLDDGRALMAFRIRKPDGSTLWSTATLRSPGGEPRTLTAVTFTPRRAWRSPRTGIAYPVAMTVEVDGRSWTLEPLMDDQELDARSSSGVLYWEGAVSLRADDGATGRGYLELTGYADRVPF